MPVSFEVEELLSG